MRIKLGGAALMLSVCIILAGCASSSSKIAFSDLPSTGNADHGAQIFAAGANEAPACTTCHRTDTTQLLGPGLGGFAAQAANRVQGLSAKEYAFQSIVSPAKFMVSGYTNLMYDKYSEKLSPQDIADVIAYLMQLGSN
jgi:mono/diheme cytochrome c family protein